MNMQQNMTRVSKNKQFTWQKGIEKLESAYFHARFNSWDAEVSSQIVYNTFPTRIPGIQPVRD